MSEIEQSTLFWIFVNQRVSVGLVLLIIMRERGLRIPCQLFTSVTYVPEVAVPEVARCICLSGND